jgi:hypothetical protein
MGRRIKSGSKEKQAGGQQKLEEVYKERKKELEKSIYNEFRS